jgi:hypothetical protein
MIELLNEGLSVHGDSSALICLRGSVYGLYGMVPSSPSVPDSAVSGREGIGIM